MVQGTIDSNVYGLDTYKVGDPIFLMINDHERTSVERLYNL